MPSSGGGRGLLSDLGGARRRRSGGRWTGGAPALDSDVPEEGNLRLAVNPEQDPDLQLIIKAVRRSTHARGRTDALHMDKDEREATYEKFIKNKSFQNQG